MLLHDLQGVQILVEINLLVFLAQVLQELDDGFEVILIEVIFILLGDFVFDVEAFEVTLK